MPPQLLTTKLYTPSVPPELVPRPRLTERLNAGVHRKLTLISAPAGFGKTTLLSEWVAGRGYAAPKKQVAWLSLDAGDNDLVRFLTYLVAALQTVEGYVGQGLLATLQSPGAVNIELLLTTLLNEIAGLPDSLILVLDDYNVIESQPVDNALTFLLDHLPPRTGPGGQRRGMHLIIATRTDPTLPLSRLRARGQLVELRAGDLRFTTDEAAAFLNRVVHLPISSDDVRALEKRTEGWITGLQLAAVAMQGLEQREQIAHFIHSFGGSHRYVIDYLVDEVLGQQTPQVQRFLLQTSILDRMTASLCNAVRFGIAETPSGCEATAVASREDSQAVLEKLEAANLFLIPLDGERRWYRYHHLFADLLRQRLRQNLPEQVPGLHCRASEWYARHGFQAEAVDHAFFAGDYGRAASLIEQIASGTMNQGHVTTILRWLDALPESMLDTRPRLRFYQAWALSMAGQPRAAEKMLLDAKSTLTSLPNSAENLALRGELSAMLAGIITSHNDPPRIIREAKEALAYLPKGNLLSRARATIALGIAYAYSDEIQKAIETYQQTRDLALRAGNPFLATVAIELLAGIQIYHQGRLKDAAQNLRQALELGRKIDGTHYAFTGLAHSLLAEINLEWNNLGAATRYLERGIELIQRGGIAHSLIHTYCAQARLKLALGETECAVEALRSADQAARATPLVQFLVHNLVYQVKLALYLGDTESALWWARGGKCELPDSLPAHLHEFQQISLAQVYLAQGDLKETMETLDSIHPQAESAGRMAHVIAIYLLKALALQEGGESAAAIECLEGCLLLAAPEGYVRTFVDCGEPMAQLIYKAAARGIMPDYTGKLLAAFDERDESSPSPQPLVEPLSERELEVLQLLAIGLSNREISERLFLAVDTVKGHNYRIYGKLGVKNRTQAINKARSLNFIPPQ